MAAPTDPPVLVRPRLAGRRTQLRDPRGRPRAGINAFVGPNGQGKTNLVEAVAYLSTLGSHRVATDAPLVRRGPSER